MQTHPSHPSAPAPAARRARAGFSLAELMVVIVILGLLATLVVPKVMDSLGFGQIGKAKSDLTAISQAVTQYAVRNGGRYPESILELIEPDSTGSKYLDMSSEPKDPWGNPYRYELMPAGDDPRYLIWCLGRDGSEGGEGDERDFNQEMIKNGEI